MYTVAVASEFLIWEQNGHVVCRVTTNADVDKLRGRLALVGLLDAVEDSRVFFADRMKGGSGYELMFATQVTWAEVRQRIVKI